MTNAIEYDSMDALIRSAKFESRMHKVRTALKGINSATYPDVLTMLRVSSQIDPAKHVGEEGLTIFLSRWNILLRNHPGQKDEALQEVIRAMEGNLKLEITRCTATLKEVRNTKATVRDYKKLDKVPTKEFSFNIEDLMG